jgi:hypothetical protein
MYSCKRCGLDFKRKDYLINHLKRKVQCEGLIDRTSLIDELKHVLTEGFKCDYCEKYFKSRQSKYQHKQICKAKTKSSDEKINELVKTVEELKIELMAIKDEKPNITNNNSTSNITINPITNNTQNNINVTIPKLKNFGWENMDAIPESLISSLFMNLRFKELLANLHCDPNFPENQNIRIKSVKRNTMEIYRNNKWDIVTFTKGLTDLLLQGHRIFSDYYNKDKKRILEEDMDEHDLKEILYQLQKIQDLNKSEIKPLIEDLQMMLEG